jgi:hypothetical protein
MKRVKLIATACFTAMLAVFTMNGAAQDFNTNERTFLTFSNTVELPGVTLQPGTYLFRLAESPANRHIVQVLSRDEKQIHATILAVPAERLEVTGENVVTFRESGEGSTPAVQYWYYPGDRIGHEFVYPKDQAIKIAARTGQNVLSTEGDISSSDARVSSTNPQGETSEWSREGSATRQGAQTAQSSGVQGAAGVSETPQQAEPAQTAQAEQPAPMAQAQPEASESVNPQSETPDPAEPETAPAEPTASATGTSGTTGTTATAQTDARRQSGVASENQAVGTSGQSEDRARELPRTASPLPLSGLIGLLSLGGALVVRRVRR